MLEETGRVIKAEKGELWIETQPRSACSHCGTDSCTTSVVAKLFNAKRTALRLPDTLGAQPGQRVRIGIPDRVLAAASLRAYLAPLALMILAVALGSALELGEVLQSLLAIAGLIGGLAWVERSIARGSKREAYAPRLLGFADEARFDIKDLIQRGEGNDRAPSQATRRL
jgi:sigma-E factor negative regulatory protein RseC